VGSVTPGNITLAAMIKYVIAAFLGEPSDKRF